MADKRKDSNGRIMPENVTQRKDGTYMWRKSIDGKKYCVYGKTLGEIKQKKDIALGEIRKGEYKGKRERMKEEKETAINDITLNEWFFQWEKAYRVGNVKETTLNKGHYIYMKYFFKTIGQMKIKNIRQIDITNILNTMNKNGQSYSSLVKCTGILSLMFNDAASNGLVDSNPAKGALKVRKQDAKEKRILSEQEEQRFIDFVKNDRYYKKYAPLFITGFGTGMRIGEILSLTWKDIDFKNNSISVNKTLSELNDYVKQGGKTRFIVTEPKTKSSIRNVPMLEKVKEALLEQKKNKGKQNTVSIDGYEDFVFTTKTGNVFYPRFIRLTIKRIIIKMNRKEKAEAEGREPAVFEYFSPHCMRHTFATRCYEKGMREKVIQKILGHSKIDMTLNVYTHTTDEMIEEDLKKMEE